MTFIPGVTLLNVYSESNEIPIWGAILIGVLLSFAVSVLGILFDKPIEKWGCRIIGWALVWTLMGLEALYPEYCLKYEVIIDSNVSYTELTDNYGNNISHKGLIYTISSESKHDWIWNMKEYENEELGKLSER